MKNSCKAILLLGPTGSGKTPLGEALERQGVSGRHVFHFDFGSHLRGAVARPNLYPLLSREDIALLQKKLVDNALLEDHEFYLAENIIRSFIQQRHIDDNDIIILNGIPRHVGQAESVDRFITVREVIYLDCSPEVVLHRIATNAGGDRIARADDSENEIARKLSIFRERTLPLIRYYKKRDIAVRKITVAISTTIEDIIAVLLHTKQMSQ